MTPRSAVEHATDSAMESRAEFSLQWNSNPGHHELQLTELNAFAQTLPTYGFVTARTCASDFVCLC